MKKILIIDDSKLTGMHLSMALRKKYEVSQAFSGTEGVEAIREKKPDCIISDLVMPEMDGFKLLEYLGGEGVQTPVVIISSNTKEATRKRCLVLGAFEVLKKPVRSEELMATVDRALQTGKRTV